VHEPVDIDLTGRGVDRRDAGRDRVIVARMLPEVREDRAAQRAVAPLVAFADVPISGATGLPSRLCVLPAFDQRVRAARQ